LYRYVKRIILGIEDIGKSAPDIGLPGTTGGVLLGPVDGVPCGTTDKVPAKQFSTFFGCSKRTNKRPLKYYKKKNHQV
jgi:hypothetical protein